MNNQTAFNNQTSFALDSPGEALLGGTLAPVVEKWRTQLRSLAEAYWADYERKSEDLSARTAPEAIDEFAQVLSLSNTIHRDLQGAGFAVMDIAAYRHAMRVLARALLLEQSERAVTA